MFWIVFRYWWSIPVLIFYDGQHTLNYLWISEKWELVFWKDIIYWCSNNNYFYFEHNNTETIRNLEYLGEWGVEIGPIFFEGQGIEYGNETYFGAISKWIINPNASICFEVDQNSDIKG